MLITIQGNKDKWNSSPSVVAVLATLNAVSLGRKTLILQLIDRNPNYCIERIMYHIEESAIEYATLTNGVDALIRQRESGRVNNDTFEDYCKSLLSQDNLLDIAESSNKIEFTRELESVEKKNAVFGLIEDAKHVYDDIYVLLSPVATNTSTELIEKADAHIICVPQSTEKVIHKDTKTRIIVTDYDNTSMYSMKYLQKHHGVKNIYVMPHNIGFKDAKISGTLLEFVTKNKNDDKSDINYRFVACMYQLLSSITGTEVVASRDYEDLMNKKPYYKTLADLKRMNAENVKVITVKNGLFKKKDKKIIVDEADAVEEVDTEESEKISVSEELLEDSEE